MMDDEYIRRSDALKGVELFQCGWAEIEAVQSDYIERLPAADVAPVVRGKWGDNGIAGSMLVKCSVCGFDCGANSFSYCPNCGARMRQATMDGGDGSE